jgi:hypothetical protein
MFDVLNLKTSLQSLQPVARTGAMIKQQQQKQQQQPAQTAAHAKVRGL